jgi:hypothetical protein
MAKDYVVVLPFAIRLIIIFKIQFLSDETRCILIAETGKRVPSIRQYRLFHVGIAEHVNTRCGPKRSLFLLQGFFCGFACSSQSVSNDLE